jgi:hypothetical protein
MTPAFDRGVRAHWWIGKCLQVPLVTTLLPGRARPRHFLSWTFTPHCHALIVPVWVFFRLSHPPDNAAKAPADPSSHDIASGDQQEVAFPLPLVFITAYDNTSCR